MAKSFFWPVFIPVSAAVLYGTWAMTPVISEKFLSPSSREIIMDLVAACVRHPLPTPAPQATATATPKVNGPSAAAATTTPKVNGPSAAADRGKSTPMPPAASASKKVPATTSAGKEKPASTIHHSAVAPVSTLKKQKPTEEELPSLLGIQQCQPGNAPWGVLNQVTTATKRDGSKISVPGGRIFIIKNREAVDRSYKLIGSFSPDKIGEPVTVSSDNLFCFTGSPNALSPNQRECLRNYYELRGKALARKDEILRANAEKSPYGRKAADVLAKFKALAAKVKQNGAETSSDENRKATYELTNLKNQLQELSAKHKAWKQEHAAELADPEQDSEYRLLLKDAQKYVEPINGMAF